MRPAALAPEIQSDEFLRLRSGAKSVVNAAIGYEYQLNDNLSLLGGIRSDISYFDNSVNEGVGALNPPLAAGISIISPPGLPWIASIAALASVCYLVPVLRTIMNRTVPLIRRTPDFYLGSRTITEARYSNFGILLGYTFYFRKFRLKEDPSSGN